MSNKLYETRVLKRMSQYVLASKTGISQSKISLVENNLAEPRQDEKRRLAKALGLRIRDL